MTIKITLNEIRMALSSGAIDSLDLASCEDADLCWQIMEAIDQMIEENKKFQAVRTKLAESLSGGKMTEDKKQYLFGENEANFHNQIENLVKKEIKLKINRFDRKLIKGEFTSLQMRCLKFLFISEEIAPEKAKA